MYICKNAPNVFALLLYSDDYVMKSAINMYKNIV